MSPPPAGINRSGGGVDSFLLLSAMTHVSQTTGSKTDVSASDVHRVIPLCLPGCCVVGLLQYMCQFSVVVFVVVFCLCVSFKFLFFQLVVVVGGGGVGV